MRRARLSAQASSRRAPPAGWSERWGSRPEARPAGRASRSRSAERCPGSDEMRARPRSRLHAPQPPPLTRRMATVPPVRHLLRAKDLADSRYREHLDIPALARAAYLSPAHFSREFRRTFGETPHHYLLTRRLERAA